MNHGGDIYKQEIRLDFSVNINPLGTPSGVVRALQQPNLASCYPELFSKRLQHALSGELERIFPGSGIEAGHICWGNGASELFLGLLQTLRPKRVLVPVPSFGGYAWAVQGCGAIWTPYVMKEEDGFCLTGAFLGELTEDVDLLILANPNNPTGCFVERELLEGIVEKCRKNHIRLILDECFMALSRSPDRSLLARALTMPHVVFVRAFTKTYAMPGLRLGYAVCGDCGLLEMLRAHLPEWNVSTYAQAAGLAVMENGLETGLEPCRELLAQEREFLTGGLKELGFLVLPSDCNFLLFYDEHPWYELLLSEGILIRDCSNVPGLSVGYYRIAVKGHEENVQLLEAIRRRKE